MILRIEHIGVMAKNPEKNSFMVSKNSKLINIFQTN